MKLLDQSQLIKRIILHGNPCLSSENREIVWLTKCSSGLNLAQCTLVFKLNRKLLNTNFQVFQAKVYNQIDSWLIKDSIHITRSFNTEILGDFLVINIIEI